MSTNVTSPTPPEVPDASVGAGAAASGAAVHPPPARRSVWTTKQKLVRVLWGTVGRILWMLLPAARPAILRAFGARVGRGCRFAADVEIAIPWNLDVGDDVTVETGTILYALGPITVGGGSVLDVRSHLCAGTHDMRDSRFPLLRPPVAIGRRCLVGVDAYVGPDVVLGDDVRVWPRASVYRSFEGPGELAGTPAKPVERADGAT